MTTETAIQILQAHNDWWRGDETEMPPTAHLVMAIDHAISELKSAADNKSIREIVKAELDKEDALRKKHEGKSDRSLGYKHSHRYNALWNLWKKIAVLLLISGGLQAQKRDNFWLKQGISATTMFASGWLSATNEVAWSDYRRYAARHPNANPKWANPKISYKNKYKDLSVDRTPKYFGSTTFLAWSTDRYHLTNTARNFLVAGNIGITMSLYEKPNWKQIGLQALSSWAAFAVGSGAAHKYYKYVD